MVLPRDCTSAPGREQEARDLLERWRGRPANFWFLQRAIGPDALGAIRGAGEVAGDPLDELEASVAANADLFGATTDVGAYDDAQALDALSRCLTDWAVTDEDAMAVAQMVLGASPAARPKLLEHLDDEGLIETLCANLPGAAVKALLPYASSELQGRMGELLTDAPKHATGSALIEEQAIGNLKEGTLVDEAQAFGWTFLDTAWNGLTAGFLHAHDAAWEARAAGLISDDSYASETTLAAGKTAAVLAASAATGGVAGAWGEGLAAGLNMGRTGALMTSGAIGGAAAGLAGQGTSDLYGMALEGQEGFSSARDYLLAGGLGAAGGAVTAGAASTVPRVAALAGKYAPSGAGAWANESVPVADKVDGYRGALKNGPGKWTQGLGSSRYGALLDRVLTRSANAGMNTAQSLLVTRQEVEGLIATGMVRGLTAPDVGAALDRASLVWDKPTLSPRETLMKVVPQSEVESSYGRVDVDGTVTPYPDRTPTTGGFVGSAEDFWATNPATDADVRQAVGVDTGAAYYAKYNNPSDPLFVLEFEADTATNVPSTHDNAKGVPLTQADPASGHVPGVGMSSGGVREGQLPWNTPVRVTRLVPVGGPRSSYPSTGAAPQPPASPVPTDRIAASAVSASAGGRVTARGDDDSR